MKLHPVAAIFSMLLCVAAFGVLGVLIAAPMVAIAAILHEELYRRRFLANVTDDELDRLARRAMGERASDARRQPAAVTGETDAAHPNPVTNR